MCKLYKSLSLMLGILALAIAIVPQSIFALAAKENDVFTEYEEAYYNLAEYTSDDYIKWVDLNASADIIKKVYELDVKYHNTETDFKFCEAMAYLAVKNGNKFNYKADLKNLQKLQAYVKEGKKINDIYPDNKYYKYYVEAYTAIFSGLIGEYKQNPDGEIKYGVKGYFPIAKGFWYNHYDDFGNSRSYGFKRKHLGHDMMGSVGAPIIAVEGGTIAELGWNQYGGWRVGIRSHDTKRYYYYAHLRKDRPYAANLKAGDTVEAGQVIGYLGNTGYSRKENVNLTSGKPHLHFGMQLIFDESQVKGNNEIWIDVYGIINFLSRYRTKVQKDAETKEYISLETKSQIAIE